MKEEDREPGRSRDEKEVEGRRRAEKKTRGLIVIKVKRKRERNQV